MKLRAIYLAFLSLTLWAGWARAAWLGQGPTPSAPTHSGQQQTQPPSPDSHSEPSANPPQQTSPPASPGPVQEGAPASPENPPRQSTETRVSGQPAAPPPKPPVLRHRKPKAAAKSGQPSRQSGADQSPGSPNKVVVRNGGAKENPGQIEPGVTTATAEQQRASTAQLLARTDANLKRVGARQLTKAEQNTMEEIRAYMSQAKMASDRGDTTRAKMLANKARLLSDDLAGK
jgi:hypothetical protein